MEKVINNNNGSRSQRKLIGESYKIKYDINKLIPLIEADESIILTALLQAKNRVNANRRIYPESVLVREDRKYQELISQGNALGELDHPQESVVEYQNVSHRIIKTWWEGDELKGHVEILKGKHFPNANILRGALLHNIPVGFSSRGLGSEHQIEENLFRIGDDFELVCYDAVVQPSTFGAFGRLDEGRKTISEELKKEKWKFDRINKIVSEIISNN